MDAHGYSIGELCEQDAWAPLLPFMGPYGYAQLHRIAEASSVASSNGRTELLPLLVDVQRNFNAEGITAVHLMDGTDSPADMCLLL